jgi:hypothetical protein
MLRGEIIIFFESGVLFSTPLKISKANELPDSIKDTCFNERFMGTGSDGRLLSGVFLQEIKIRQFTSEIIINGLSMMVFMIT